MLIAMLYRVLLMHLAQSYFKYLTALILVVLIIYLESFIYDHNLMFTLSAMWWFWNSGIK